MPLSEAQAWNESSNSLTGDGVGVGAGSEVARVVGGAFGVGVVGGVGEGAPIERESEQLHSTSILMLESLERVTVDTPGIPPSPLPSHSRHSHNTGQGVSWLLVGYMSAALRWWRYVFLGQPKHNWNGSRHHLRSQTERKARACVKIENKLACNLRYTY